MIFGIKSIQETYLILIKKLNMIEIINKNLLPPYLDFYHVLDLAQSSKQKAYDAICVSSYDPITNEVNSRFVNLKYIDNEDWIFFTNYDGKKAHEFKLHNQISVTIYWADINFQIRIKAKINKCSEKFSDKHFQNRSLEKNALALSSMQSKKIDSYESVVNNYNSTLKKANLSKRPIYWGGFRFKPYYFEFWEGHASRINKRKVYEILGKKWQSHILQP